MYRPTFPVCLLIIIAEFPSFIGGHQAPQEFPFDADLSDRLILLQGAATTKSRASTDSAGDMDPVSADDLATFCSESEAHQDFPALSDANPLSAPLVRGPEALELLEPPKDVTALSAAKPVGAPAVCGPDALEPLGLSKVAQLPAFALMVRAGLWVLILGFTAMAAVRRSQRGPSDAECSPATAAHAKNVIDVSASGSRCSELHEAALAGDDVRCEVLLGGPELFPCFGLMEALIATDASGATALHAAASVGAETVAELLLEYGAPVDVEDFRDETPLHLAARGGHVAVCEMLVRRGASLRATNVLDCTPLVVAGHAGQEPVCRRLLALGAGVESLPDDEFPDLLLKLMTEVPLATAR